MREEEKRSGYIPTTEGIVGIKVCKDSTHARGSYRILRLEGETAKVGIETGTWFSRSPLEGLGACHPLKNFGKIDALRLILRHFRGTSSHSVIVEVLCTCITCEILVKILYSTPPENSWGGYPILPPLPV